MQPNWNHPNHSGNKAGTKSAGETRAETGRFPEARIARPREPLLDGGAENGRVGRQLVAANQK
jgi:hypothetical protein